MKTVLTLSAMAVAASLGAASMASAEEVRVALSWLRNGEFAPVMIADAKGYFKKEGIELSIIDGGPGRNPVATVGAGQAEFGIGPSNSIFGARLSTTPVDIVGIGTLEQVSPLGYIRLANPSDPAPEPKDMEGKSVGVQANGEAFLAALAKVGGADFSKINIKTVMFNAEPLMLGQVDYFAGFITNQPYQIETEAVKENAIASVKGKIWQAVQMGDYIAYPTDVIYTTGSMVKDNPDLIRRFLRATARGLRDNLDNPSEAVDILASYPDQVEDAAKLAWRFKIQNQLSESAYTAEHGLLAMDPEGWQRGMKLYKSAGQIDKVLPVDEVMTNTFIPGIE